MKIRANYKAVISLVLCLMFILSAAVFAEGKTVNEKAKVLNDINILKGNGVDFDLDGQLVRAEAAAFIVRMMGKEKEVLAESEKWSNTRFGDVDKSKWYAPYIGYCSSKGIIDGYPNGKYGPNDNISEKAFLKLALGVIGYSYNMDYSWDTVYIRAFEAGLVADPAYAVKTKDNNQYKRSSVIDVLFNTLDKANVSSKVKTIENLISKGVVDRKTAVAIGLVNDKIITEIAKIDVVDATTVSIKLNEAVIKPDSKSIMITDASNKAAALTVSVKSHSNDEIVLMTSSHTPGKDYNILIKGIEDSDGNKCDVTGTFKGFEPVEVNSDFFRINKIEVVSKNVINVFFTQPINMGMEIPLYYDVLQEDSTYIKGSFQSASIKVLAPYNNAISIFFKERDLQHGVNYTLKIGGEITSAYSVKLNDGYGDKMNFTARGDANESFYVVNVSPINKKQIKVQFNRDVDLSSAQSSINYAIKDSIGIPGGIIKAVVNQEGSMKNKEVILEVAPLLESSKGYELTINNVYDSFNQMHVDNEGKYPFSGVSTEAEDIKIVNVTPNDKGTITVYFNKPLNTTTAKDMFRYTLTGITDPSFIAYPSAVYYDSVENPYMVKLHVSGNPLVGSASYKLIVDRLMQDYLGNDSNSSTEMTFTGTNNDNIAPFIVEAKTISSKVIKVVFSEEILPSGFNTMASNYSLEYKDGSNTVSRIPSSVNYIGGDTITLVFDSIDFAKAHTLKFTNLLTDYSGANSRMATDSMNGISVSLGR